MTVSVPAWFPFGSRVGRYVVSVLDRLGYHARLRESANPYAPAAVGRLQLGLTGWLPNFAAAADFFEQDLTCRSARVDRADNAAAFCDPAVDREIARAQELEVSDPAHAALLWARVDRDVVDQAPWVPFANGVSVAVVSRRVGDYQYSPQWGPLLDQLWVR